MIFATLLNATMALLWAVAWCYGGSAWFLYGSGIHAGAGLTLALLMVADAVRLNRFVS